MSSTLIRHPLNTVTVLLASLAPVLGESPTALASPVAAGSVIFSLVRMFGALALVLACFAGGVWLFKNWQLFAGRKGPAPKVNILEVKSLGHRQALYLVGYEQQRFLLAASPAGVAMLTPLPAADHEATDDIVVPQPNFTDALLHTLSRKS